MEKKYRELRVMGTIFLASLTILVVVLIGNEIFKSSFIGLDSENLPTIKVQGEGKVSAVPNTAEVAFSVVTEKDDSQEAMEENSKKMQSIVDYLKEEGVEDEEMQTLGVSVRPLRDWSPEILEDRTYGYEARNILEVRIKDIEKMQGLIDGAMRAGANEVSRFQLTIDDEEEYKKEAREKAIKEAKERAEEIAAGLEVKVGRVMSFSEERSHYYYAARSEVAEDVVGEEPTEVPIEPGEDEITVNVSVEYEIR